MVTFAAAVILIISPTLVPKTVDIQLSPDQNLLSYFLGASELGIAYLSFQSRNISDKYALRAIVISFIIFHSVTAILEIYGLSQLASSKIIANILLRIIIVVLFYYYGIYKINRIG